VPKHDPSGISPVASTVHVSRRRFLTLSIVTASAAVMAACQQTTSPASKPAESKPAESKPAEAAKPAAPAATQAPAPAQPAAPQATAKPAVQVANTPAVSVAATAQPAAAGKPGGTKIYRLGSLPDVVSMDPANMSNQIDFQIAEMIFNLMGRYTYDPPLGNAITPELAENWEIKDDAKTWIFHIRKGVKFQKGYGDLTAEDVKANWEHIKKPDTASPFRVEFGNSTIDVLDPYTVQVKFDQPKPSFMTAVLGFRPGFIVSPKARAELGDRWKSNPIGSGPYVWSDYQAGTSLTMTKNPDYWGQKPMLDEIHYRFKIDDRAAPLAVSKGELDAFYLSDPDAMIAAAKNTDPNVTFHKSAAGQAPYVQFFNMRRKPLDDIRVRHALRYAIDNEAIAKELFGGLADPLHSFLPPSMFGFSKDVMEFEYNPDKAKQLLKDANVPADWEINLISYSTLLICRRVTEAVVSYWEDIGLKVKPELLDSALYGKRNSAREFDVSATYITRIDPEQLAVPYFRSDSSGNSSGYTGADDLIDRARTEPDADKRAKIWRDLQDKVSQDSPASFIISVAEGIILNKRVKGHTGTGWQERHPVFTIDVPAE
jgi:peptide/nickel transport system substrate-binding protein